MSENLRQFANRGVWTLFRKELLRFWRVSFQTVAAPVLTALLYLLVQVRSTLLLLRTLLIIALVLTAGALVMSSRRARTEWQQERALLLARMDSVLARSDSAIATALDATFVADNRTSFGDPVEPEVDISAASDGCRS